MASSTKSSYASDKFRKTSSGKNPENASQVNWEPRRPTYTCYIPESIDIDSLLLSHPPSGIPSFHRDYLVYIIDLISTIPLRNKGQHMEYVPLWSSLLQKRVRHYRKYLDYLVDVEILSEDKQYIKGVKSRGFQFKSRYQVKNKPILITRPTLIKSILEFKNVDYSNFEVGSYAPTLKSSINNDFESIGYLIHWFNDNLSINYNAADEYLLNLLAEERSNPKVVDADLNYRIRNTTIQKIKRGEFNPGIDSTSNRLHSAITQVKSNLRQFITYDNLPLTAVDIVNSQPYISTLLLNLDGIHKYEIINKVANYNKSYTEQQTIMLVKTIEKAITSYDACVYKDIVSTGKFYEEFGKILLSKDLIKGNGDIRSQAKKTTFQTLFSPNKLTNHIPAIQSFREVFPSVFDVFETIKINNHSALPILLQNIEARIVLLNICQEISKANPAIPLFTLHDSIITTTNHAQYVYEVMYTTLYNEVGIPPTLKFEDWNSR